MKEVDHDTKSFTFTKQNKLETKHSQICLIDHDSRESIDINDEGNRRPRDNNNNNKSYFIFKLPTSITIYFLTN